MYRYDLNFIYFLYFLNIRLFIKEEKRQPKIINKKTFKYFLFLLLIYKI